MLQAKLCASKRDSQIDLVADPCSDMAAVSCVKKREGLEDEDIARGLLSSDKRPMRASHRVSTFVPAKIRCRFSHHAQKDDKPRRFDSCGWAVVLREEDDPGVKMTLDRDGRC